MVVTGNVFNHLVFGGISSADYGIYITGEAVYNAPTRAVEMVSVPGRNGDVPIDMGHWDNIEVKYTAGTFAQTSAEFAAAISNFRNAIMSLIGYQRLEDTYNPNEYRLGIFVAGLEIEPSSGGKAGEFDIVFNCKPQRWLTSGESEITVSSGDEITNPTGYDSSPLIKIEGEGTVTIDDYEIELLDMSYGNVTLWEENSYQRSAKSFHIIRGSNTPLNEGDPISFEANKWTASSELRTTSNYQIHNLTASAVCSGIDGATVEARASYVINGVRSYTITTEWDVYVPATLYQFAIEEERELLELEVSVTLSYKLGTITYTRIYKQIYTVTVGSADSQAVARARFNWENSRIFNNEEVALSFAMDLNTPRATAVSSADIAEDGVTIDSETGDAYAVNGETYISLNKYIQLGAQLPTLKPGANEITYDDTITSLKITPRWWKL